MTKESGFTLIEVMIAVAIVAILATVAYPAYSKYVQSSRRTEATAALTKIANLEERYYLDNNQYGGLSDLNLSTTYYTDNSYYQITITASSSSYTLTATAINSQANDSECATFTLDQDGTKGSSTANATTCWR